MKKKLIIAAVLSAISTFIFLASFWWALFALLSCPILIVSIYKLINKKTSVKTANTLVTLALLVSTLPFYGISNVLIHTYFAPSAEIILSNNFKGKFAIFSKSLTSDISIKNLGKHYKFVVPETGYLEPKEGWLYLSFKANMKPNVPGYVSLRYENGNIIQLSDFSCVYTTNYQEFSSKYGIACSVKEPLIADQQLSNLEFKKFIDSHFNK